MKQEYEPYCDCEACSARIYRGSEEPICCCTLARQLRLPEGWAAEEYIACITLTHTNGKKVAFAKPYRMQTQAWWEHQAAEAILNSLKIVIVVV